MSSPIVILGISSVYGLHGCFNDSAMLTWRRGSIRSTKEKRKMRVLITKDNTKNDNRRKQWSSRVHIRE